MDKSLIDGGTLKDSTSLPNSAHDSSLSGKSAGSVTEEFNGGKSKSTLPGGGGNQGIGGKTTGEPINQKANGGDGTLLPNASK